MKTVEVTLCPERNVTLTGYLQQVGGEFRHIVRRPAVLVLPGGAYQMCSDREADPVAIAYLNAGYQAFILRYSVQSHATWPNPLRDVEEALSLIRDHGENWGVYPDKIAVIGFSAGGHLAACAATMAQERPNAAIIGYGVTLGRDMNGNVQGEADAVSAVDGKTPPCFLFTVRTDPVVPIDNQFRFMEALTAQDISFETHIYSYGPHGFSVGTPAANSPDMQLSPRVRNWVAESIGWLNELFGTFGDKEMTPALFSPRLNRDDDGYFSVDCTIAHLSGNPLAGPVIAPMLNRCVRIMYPNLPEPERDQKAEAIRAGSAGKLTLRGAMSFAKIPDSDVQQLNEQLQHIVIL